MSHKHLSYLDDDQNPQDEEQSEKPAESQEKSMKRML